MTLWTLMMFPQSSMYCFKSFSWKKERHFGPTWGTLNVSTCMRRSDTDQVLKHERQALVGVDDVMKSDDICVLQVLQQRHYKRGQRCQSGADAERANQTALGTVEDSQTFCQQDEVRTRWSVLYLLWWPYRARPPRAPAGSLSERPSCRLICFGLWKQWRKFPAEASH